MRQFTLIELLVVVGIIAILMTMLLPALRKSRKYSLKIYCVSNLKQIGTSLQMYGNDNDSFFPTAENWWSEKVLGEYLKTTQSQAKLNTIVWCPSETRAFILTASEFDDPANEVYFPYPNYAYLYYWGSTQYNTFWKLSKIGRPSEKIVVADGFGRKMAYEMIVSYGSLANARERNLYGENCHYCPLARHDNYLNALFFDLHVDQLADFGPNDANNYVKFYPYPW